MRWLKPNLKNSIYALLGHVAGPSGNQLAAAVDQIRRAMLSLLGEQGQLDHPILARRLRHATEIQALWFARDELMAALAMAYGEAKARQKVEGLAALFEGLLPGGLGIRRRGTTIRAGAKR